MIVLGIESSCDETALALVDNGRVSASVMASQADLHALFGGVVPELASREHARLIGPLFDSLLAQSGATAVDIDRIAFARGPGLLGSLLVGGAFAKALAFGLGKPLLGINHLHAHLLVAGLEHELRYPALGLLVSGGHTHIYRITSPLNFVLLGRTLDDAAGEAFDKTGKLLNLPYPAGRLIDELAEQGNVRKGLFSLPYVNNESLDFSFSGLKTAAALTLSSGKPLQTKETAGNDLGEQDLRDFCATLNSTIAQTLRIKLERALNREQGICSLVVAGGVAANSAIRLAIADLAADYALPLALPSPTLCTDNGVMIAYAGWLLAKEGLRSELGISCVPRGTPVPTDFIRIPTEEF